MRLPTMLLILACAVLPAGEDNPDLEGLLKEFRRLDQVLQVVQREYVTPVDRKDLWDAAINGLMTGLDPACRYIPPQELLLSDRQEGRSGSGFGFDWRPDPDNERVAIARVLPGGPAERAGMVRGDSLIALAGQEVDRLPLARLRQLLLELPDQTVIRIRHADGQFVDLPLKRESYEDNGIGTGWMLDPAWGIGLVPIHRFVQGSSEAKTNQANARTVTALAFRAEVTRLEKLGLRGLILDLRGNGGGSLLAAVEVADCFLDPAPDGSAIIAALVSRNPSYQTRYLPFSANTLPPWPLAVLIDGDTASAAEVLAAALRDHGRAALVGTPTHGKDTVQQRFLLDGGGALQLTVAHYRTPSGTDLTRRGLIPDVVEAEDDRTRLALARHAALSEEARKDRVAPQDTPVLRAREVLIGALLLGGIPVRARQ